MAIVDTSASVNAQLTARLSNVTTYAQNQLNRHCYHAIITSKTAPKKMRIADLLHRKRLPPKRRLPILHCLFLLMVADCDGFQCSPLHGILKSKRIAWSFHSGASATPFAISDTLDADDLPKAIRPPQPKTLSQRTNYNHNRNNNNNNNRQNRDDPVLRAQRWRDAIYVEDKLASVLESIVRIPKEEQLRPSFSLSFPSVRDCNAALATFGDNGELLRALRLFMKMRKAAALAEQRRGNLVPWRAPTPTLVTYSTLMSRAVQAGKPRVALRLWKLMRQNADGSSNMIPAGGMPKSSSQPPIVPDVKAANILMNAYAKLADVAAAQDLLRQMLHGNGTDVPRLSPNLVTYNTLLDACHKAGELDAALEAKQQLDESRLMPDTRTYTTLIATVARKASSTSGAHDPTLAFSFLNEMNLKGIRPNGMTYSALIDVCGRCRRSDLALQGLRIMLRQKAEERKNFGEDREYTFLNEVGAWTAAIDAVCDRKSGQNVDTGMRLFRTMLNFGVKPNTVTCGCLVDRLLKQGRISDTVEILRYMNKNGIVPSEVFYTSLITSARKLVLLENNRQCNNNNSSSDSADESIDPQNEGNAIQVYTELINNMLRAPLPAGAAATKAAFEVVDQAFSRPNKAQHANTLLVKVFLVFQEMKAVGAQPDLACYNALLHACAEARDLDRCHTVLDMIQTAGLFPNDNSWREIIRACGSRSDLAAATWKMGLAYTGSKDDESGVVRWIPSIKSFDALLTAYLRHASTSDDFNSQRALYKQVVDMYGSLLSREAPDDATVRAIDIGQVQQSAKTMLLFLQAIVSYEQIEFANPIKTSEDIAKKLRLMGSRILDLECLQDEQTLANLFRNDRSRKAVQVAKTWNY